MLAPLRHQGNHGTIIDPHRSIATVRLTRVDVLLAAALAIATSVTIGLNLGTIGKLWTWIYVRLAGPLGFTGGVGQQVFETPLIADFTIPYFNTSAPLPSESVWWVALVVTALVLLVSFVLPPSWLPFAYLLRLVVLVQCTALAFFRVAPSRFPYDLPHYMSAMLAAGIAVMLVIPVLLALTFYVIDVGVLRKIVLTVVMLGHLLVFIPLQYAVHAWLVVHGTLLLLPVLFMLFGLLPEVMILIALYGWGMSWRAQRARTRRE
ncbi:MAG: hypothetical protein ABI625_11085 [bacterium]